MGCTIHQTYFDIRHREPGDNAAFECFFDAFLSRLDELLRNGTTANGVLKHETFTRLRWLNLDLHAGKLTLTTCLTLECRVRLGSASDRLAIGDARLTNIS